jgi:hypothetical protein
MDLRDFLGWIIGESLGLIRSRETLERSTEPGALNAHSADDLCNMAVGQTLSLRYSSGELEYSPESLSRGQTLYPPLGQR